jgi:ribosomal protein L23
MAQNAKVKAAFHEVFHNKPSTVKKSKSPEGQRKQMVAIALSKARAAGAHIPMKKGIAKLGEKRG